MDMDTLADMQAICLDQLVEHYGFVRCKGRVMAGYCNVPTNRPGGYCGQSGCQVTREIAQERDARLAARKAGRT